MARMSIRATYALDPETDQHIKRLARVWQVSQAEVIRRSVRSAAQQANDALSPADVVAYYADNPALRDRRSMHRLVEAQHDLRHADDEQRADPRST